MKTFISTFFVSLLLFCSHTHATLLFEDDFTAVPAGPDYSFSNDGTPTITSAGNLSYTGLKSSGNSADISIFQTDSFDADTTLANDSGFTNTSPLLPGTSIYFSVLMQVPDLAAFGNNGGSAYAGFDLTGSNRQDYGLGLEVSSAGVITYGADRGSSTTNLGGTVAEGQTVLMVGRITGWTPNSPAPPTTFEYTLNPNLSLSEAAQSWSSVSAVGSVSTDAYASESHLRVNAFTTVWGDDNNARFLVDEHRVGTDWDSVTPVIPEPATIVMFGITLGAVGIVGWCRRR